MMASLWMGDLDTYVDEAFVTSAFAAMGETVVSVKMIKNRTTGAPAGYCFVDFGDSGTAQKIMSKLNGLPLPGSNPIKRFKLNWATYGKDITSMGPEFSIFVGDLTPDVSDHMLQEFFQKKFPSCKAAKVVLDASGNSRGYGFVRFFDETEHRRAMTEMQGAVGCGSKPVRVSAATPKRPSATPAYSGSTAPAPASASNQYGSQYTQQYQQYQQYMAAWQGYQQPQQQHPQYYQQYQQYATQYGQDYQQQTALQTYDLEQAAVVTVDNTIEDPNPPLDIDEENKIIMNTEAELFYELERSRWHPVETVTSNPRPLLT